LKNVLEKSKSSVKENMDFKEDSDEGSERKTVEKLS
jgi:hypothetical protein